jgi:hypothetical protein
MGLTHVLTRAAAGLAQLESRLQLPQDGSVRLLIIDDEQQTLRDSGGGGGVAGPRARRVPAWADSRRRRTVRRSGVPDAIEGRDLHCYQQKFQT